MLFPKHRPLFVSLSICVTRTLTHLSLPSFNEGVLVGNSDVGYADPVRGCSARPRLLQQVVGMASRCQLHGVAAVLTNDPWPPTLERSRQHQKEVAVRIIRDGEGSELKDQITVLTAKCGQPCFTRDRGSLLIDYVRYL